MICSGKTILRLLLKLGTRIYLVLLSFLNTILNFDMIGLMSSNDSLKIVLSDRFSPEAAVR
ncbi:hypothetical protein BN903_234 [Halorubrum sp. AJ67]|nr:hypothetical protein BN903_234 [Halorubrum sp. AJ67]